MSDYFDLIYEYRWMFAKGILLTLGVSALSTLMGVVLGMVGALGLSYGQAMRYIIVPQAVRRMLPPLGNEFITLLKDSSLVSTVALAELMSVYNAISGRFYIYKEPAYTVALLYLAMTSCLTILFAWLEKRYGGRRR